MTAPVARDPRGRFRPGVTGNPSGRPRGATQACCIQRLLQSAAPLLIERAVARAMQPEAGDEIIAAVLNMLASAEVSAALRDAVQLNAASGA